MTENFPPIHTVGRTRWSRETVCEVNGDSIDYEQWKVESTIQTIFLLGYGIYEKTRKLPDHIRKAANSIMLCRTAALGGHVQECPEGHYRRQWYNSCKHRMCPLCAYTQIARWLRKQKARLLDTAHFHVVFTISDELHFLWRLNREVMTNILFKAATETLFQLLEDKQFLGAKPGIIASLHTWCKTLALHPHLHCLVTGGGWNGKRWVSSKKQFLLPVRVVSSKFRGKFIYHVRKAVHDGTLALPDGMSIQKVDNLLNKLGRKKWNVHVRETYYHGEGVLLYLARYLRGGPIANSRIKKIKDGNVTFSCGREKAAYMTLTLEQFIGRYVQHVPPAGMVQVRSYGLYHQNCRDVLGRIRKIFGQPPVEKVEFADWQTLCSEAGDEHPELCPVCGRRLVPGKLIIVRNVSDPLMEVTTTTRKVA